MSEDHGPITLGDMVVGLVAELQERVELEGEARRIILLTVALAANNGRLIGMNELVAQAREQGIELDVSSTPIEQDAPATLAQALGEA
jgi:hypothetical protein